MNKSMIYEQIFLQSFAKNFIERLILDIQIREEKLNRREVLDFLVSLFSEELKYFIEPYKYKCPNILSMIKNYKESFLEVLGKFFVDFKDASFNIFFSIKITSIKIFCFCKKIVILCI